MSIIATRSSVSPKCSVGLPYSTIHIVYLNNVGAVDATFEVVWLHAVGAGSCK